MTENEKQRFYESAARRFKAETKLYGATAAVHLENKNDEVFWGKVLRYLCPGKKFRFISSSRSSNGNETCGCTQCLQYINFLDERFWIAIDSDYRYLNEDSRFCAKNFVLQTYTYSFENHFCFSKNVNRALQASVSPQKFNFDFEKFLKEYSRIIYPLMVWQFYLQNIDKQAFPTKVFHRILSVMSFPARFYENNGKVILDTVNKKAQKLLSQLKANYPDADYTWYEARCNELGVHRDNAYLFARGHNVYDMVVYMGRKMVAHARSNYADIQREHGFEYNLLSNICFNQYQEIKMLADDVKSIMCTNSK